MPLTADKPKSFVQIGGKRILDWTLDAFRQEYQPRFIFVGGYQIEMVRRDYPAFDVIKNADWSKTNILFSLLCARDHFRGGFYSTYTDTLYRDTAVKQLSKSPHEITLVMDTHWRQRYRFRSEHPEQDAEKIIAHDGVITRVSRKILPDAATGEFTGLLKMNERGANIFLDYYDSLYASLGPDGTLPDGKPFRMAYLIQQLDKMLQDGIKMHCVSVPGNYHEIDTLQDYHLASNKWQKSDEN